VRDAECAQIDSIRGLWESPSVGRRKPTKSRSPNGRSNPHRSRNGEADALDKIWRTKASVCTERNAKCQFRLAPEQASQKKISGVGARDRQNDQRRSKKE